MLMPGEFTTKSTKDTKNTIEFLGGLVVESRFVPPRC
jgi:hypothetical protein